MQNTDLIKYQTYANALVKLNQATNVLLRSGANEEAIKYLLKGTNLLFEELAQLIKKLDADTFVNNIMVEFDDARESRVGIDTQSDKSDNTPRPRT